MTTVFRALQSLPAVGGDHGLRLRITLARCFREIGVLQPLVCAVSRDKGGKIRPTEGRRARGGCLRFAKYLVD